VIVPLGLAKLLVLGSIATAGLGAGYQAVRPSAPMTPEARLVQAVKQQKDWSKLKQDERRAALRRGIDSDNYRKLTSNSKLLPKPKPSVLSRLFGKVPKPRIPIRLR